MEAKALTLDQVLIVVDALRLFVSERGGVVSKESIDEAERLAVRFEGAETVFIQGEELTTGE